MVVGRSLPVEGATEELINALLSATFCEGKPERMGLHELKVFSLFLIIKRVMNMFTYLMHACFGSFVHLQEAECGSSSLAARKRKMKLLQIHPICPKIMMNCQVCMYFKASQAKIFSQETVFFALRKKVEMNDTKFDLRKIKMFLPKRPEEKGFFYLDLRFFLLCSLAWASS
jgi:hypothetical protein